jgi:hypothetical protein
VTPYLLRCGAVGGPLFVLAFLIEGAVRADYHPIRHPVSSLSLGEYGWTQITNFIVTGVLMLAFAVGTWRTLRQRGQKSTWGPLLIGVYAIGLIGAGVFVTDPISGYPPGTPASGEHTWHGNLHDVPFSLLVFVALPAACFVFTRRFAGWGQRGWAVYSAATGVLFLIGFFITSAGFSQAEGLVDIAGLLQRLTISIGWLWLTLLAIHLNRTDPAPA